MNEQRFWEPAFSDYFISFKGRIGRFEFLLLHLALNLFGFLIVAAISGLGYLVLGDTGVGIGYFTGYFVILWPSFALAVKRCHDRNRSGLFVLIAFIPVMNLWYLYEMLFAKGSAEENEYGFPSFETTCNIFEPSCPQCGAAFNVLERLTQPSTCGSCWNAR